ncbi:uncharacterized protein LOC105423591 [Pogonomyrmex barbatus]|uniref:Uncharacterized protein LOC105423591 n=1 Tax=Pogonomyrmex barbatus TaxID=144034 RepID=A0A6I9WIY9_9HYME|nr:uncharacterized protein LOC105423591 [Pogonomyrmex barbatus]
MRVSILILCLTVVYGSCRTIGEEKIDFIKKTNNEDYKLDYANVPFEKSLSRQRRDSLSQIVSSMKYNVRNEIPDLIFFVYGIMTGQKDLCPKNISSEDLIESLMNITTEPIKTFKAIVCYIQVIGNQNSNALLQEAINFFKKFLPKLNEIAESSSFPSSLEPIIYILNIINLILQMYGYGS